MFKSPHLIFLLIKLFSCCEKAAAHPIFPKYLVAILMNLMFQMEPLLQTLLLTISVISIALKTVYL